MKMIPNESPRKSIDIRILAGVLRGKFNLSEDEATRQATELLSERWEGVDYARHLETTLAAVKNKQRHERAQSSPDTPASGQQQSASFVERLADRYRQFGLSSPERKAALRWGQRDKRKISDPAHFDACMRETAAEAEAHFGGYTLQ